MPTHSQVTAAWDMDVCHIGLVVIGHDGHVSTANDRARALLNVQSVEEIDDRVKEIDERMVRAGRADGEQTSAAVDLPGLGILNVQALSAWGSDGRGRVLLLRDALSTAAVATVLQHAARHRSFTALSRDWAHDVKGILHVIRINHALMTRALQDASGSAEVPFSRKVVDAIPREVERLDRFIELVFNTKPDERSATFDVGETCTRLMELIGPRAARQHVEIALDILGGSTETVGFEDQMHCAVLNLLVNALEAMPDRGRLLVSVEGGPSVRIHVRDNGAGIQPELQERLWQAHSPAGDGRTGIGLDVTRSVVEAHGGRIACTPNLPGGTCFEIELPSAAAIGL